VWTPALGVDKRGIGPGPLTFDEPPNQQGTTICKVTADKGGQKCRKSKQCRKKAVKIYRLTEIKTKKGCQKIEWRDH